MGRFDILHEIQRLDPERDDQRIVRDLFASWTPRVMAPMTRPMIRGALRMRSRVIRWLPPRLVAGERARAESANAGKP